MVVNLKWGLGITGILTLGMIFYGLFYLEMFYHPLFFSSLLVSFTFLGILAPFSFKFQNLKIITFLIFITGLIANIFWFFIVEFSYLLFFSICNLNFTFIYALFFVLMPHYAIKYQGKYEQQHIRGYHIHENIYGFLFILIGFLLNLIGWWPTNIPLLDFVKYHILLYLGTAFIILGGFLIGRDYHDLKQLRFIERIETQALDPNFNIRHKYYRISPSGIVFTLFGIIFLFNRTVLGYLSPFNENLFIVVGFGLIIIGGIIGGLNPTYFAKKTKVL